MSATLRTSRGRITFTAGAALVAALGVHLLAFAQVQVGSGHALDSSLQMGMGGFNNQVGARSSLAMPTYIPRAAMQPSFGGGPGMAVMRESGSWGDPANRMQSYNAFLNERTYSPVRQPRDVMTFTGPPPAASGWSSGGGANPGAVPVDLRAR